MKRLAATATTTVEAPAARAMELLSAVDRYPDWDPEQVPRTEVLQRDAAGTPTRARTTLHVALGPLTRDFELDLDVEVGQDNRILLSRRAHGPGDTERFEVEWKVEAGPPTRIRVALEAELDIPRFLPVPVDQLSQNVAQGLVEAARTELEGSRPNASASSS
jgi:Polyketide cyclase / dehydrase and lipid transport